MSDPKLIAAGQAIAHRLYQAQTNSIAAGNNERAKLSSQDVRALDAFRSFQLATLVAEIEDSDEGAQIRRDAAREVYRNYVTAEIAASMKG